MRKTLFTIIIAMLATVVCSGVALAAPDQYAGDTAIYGGTPAVLQPNVLIILDNSGSMDDLVAGGSYDPNTLYTTPYTQTSNCSGNCIPTAVYQTWNGGSTGSFLNANVINITNNPCPTGSSTYPRTLLLTTGMYNGRRLNASGTCRTSGSATYVLGNYINWYHSSTGFKPKIQIARDVVTNLINSTSEVKFGLMRFRSDNEGSRFLSTSVVGADYVTTVKDMDALHTGTTTTTNRAALVAAVNTLTAETCTPLGEALFEAMRYFSGGATAFGNTIGVTSGSYTTPIEAGCQKNYVIFVTDGMATADGTAVLDLPLTTYGRLDGGFCVGYGTPTYTTCNDSCGTVFSCGTNTRCHALPGIAKYMYEHDLISGLTSTRQNNVTTYTIGFDLGGANQQAVDLLKLAADNNHGGRGKYFPAGSETELSGALTTIIADIFEVNTSFVAPVVPVSPENNVYSGQRVYMGFFKPESGLLWNGNLKKFGIGCATSDNPLCLHGSTNMLNTANEYANFVDANGDGLDDRDNQPLNYAATGSFRPSSFSYWSAAADGGDVTAGGAGEKLLNRAFTLSCTTCDIAGTEPRKIYTMTGTSNLLTNSSNLFGTTNSYITASLLGLPGPIITTATANDVKQLINFVHGFDVYASSNPTNKRPWLLGDILHSKPFVVSYATYTFNSTNEADCLKNKTMVYVGSNDGMLHAFNDCDGSEAWAFIPPDQLPYLQYLHSVNHSYFVDSTIQSYVYDQDNDGTIDSGDQVIILLGMRRGGGSSSAPTTGSYYALDVTNPVSPIFIGGISNTTRWQGATAAASTLYRHLGEVWSEPKLVKTKVSTQDKIIAFIGGGYDNCNEDGRFGATQTFTGSCVNAIATLDGGLDGSSLPMISSGTTAVSTLTDAQYKGRSMYAVDIATLTVGVPSFVTFGDRLAHFDLNSSPVPLEYSMASEMTAVDMNRDGFVDRLYMGDTGGNMWRFDVSSSDVSLWSVTKIFSSNPGYPLGSLASSDTGRKMFYKPSPFVDVNGIVWLYFGTGDREHPLNRGVTDRMYGLIDKGQTSAKTEHDLLDVTVDKLQAGTGAEVTAVLNWMYSAVDNTDTTHYGWFIRLDAGDRTPVEAYPGEKVLAPATLYNKVVYFTTFQPNIGIVTDPCAGNLGTGRVYIVDYKYGSAALNLDPNNDTLYSTYSWNTYATPTSAGGGVLLRSDRVMRIGTGIPSGVVVPTSGGGGCIGSGGVLIGCGGGICPVPKAGCGAVLPLYWRQR